MSPSRRAMGLDALAQLEEERDFLLRSLRELEREREEGTVDEADYERLRDDYTARAAAVLRSIEGGVDARPEAPPVSTRRRVLTAGAIVLFAVLAAVILTRALGERLPGQTATGNDQVAAGTAEGDAPSLDELREAVADAPDDAELRLAYANTLLSEGEGAEALRQYDAAAALAPDDARPRAAAAMVVFEAGLVDESLRRLDAAEAADPELPDTYFFRGLVLYRGAGDGPGARAAFERYLELAPDGIYAEDAELVVEIIDGEAPSSESPSPDSPPSDQGE